LIIQQKLSGASVPAGLTGPVYSLTRLSATGPTGPMGTQGIQGISSGILFYINQSVPSDISAYNSLSVTPSGASQQTISSSFQNNQTKLISVFANSISSLNNPVFIPAGIWDLNIFAAGADSSDANKVRLYFNLYKRTSDGVETQISTSSSTVLITSTASTQYTCSLEVPYTILSEYTYLVVKIYGISTQTATISTYYEGTATYSHLHTSFTVQGNTGPQGPTGAKTFVIDHPTKPAHYLVHACVEGPEAGVYYRGTAIIERNKTVVELPEYVNALADQFTVHLTQIENESESESNFILLKTSTVKNNRFTVYSTAPCKINWLVFGNRKDVNLAVEIKKEDKQIRGEGPYTWVSD